MLPSEVVELIRSDDPNERIRGIRASGRLIEGPADHRYEACERLHCATLPRRLYELIFSHDPAIAREAGFTLVSRSNSFKHEFEGVDSYGDAKTIHRRLYAQRLVEMLYKHNARCFMRGEARRKDGLVHITVDLSRKLPFDIDGIQPFLPIDPYPPNSFFYIGSPSAKHGAVNNVIMRQLSDLEMLDGFLVRASGDMEYEDREQNGIVEIVIYYRTTTGRIRAPLVH